jgi:hypothetical protein
MLSHRPEKIITVFFGTVPISRFAFDYWPLLTANKVCYICTNKVR